MQYPLVIVILIANHQRYLKTLTVKSNEVFVYLRVTFDRTCMLFTYDDSFSDGCTCKA